MYSQHSDAKKRGVAHPCGLMKAIQKQTQKARKEKGKSAEQPPFSFSI